MDFSHRDEGICTAQQTAHPSAEEGLPQAASLRHAERRTHLYDEGRAIGNAREDRDNLPMIVPDNEDAIDRTSGKECGGGAAQSRA
jgi:hypothetical protein